MYVEVLLWIDGGFKQRHKHVAQQLPEAVHHLVLIIHVAGKEETQDGPKKHSTALQHQTINYQLIMNGTN